ncbi:MAG TPA: hypothetical protein EYP23_05005 [Thermoplasmata archaeon]|nr:hypothetical protein [Thermoplasmata archaeon]
MEKGNIELQLEKYNLSPGDTIKGEVLLKLKKPVHARALKIRFIGEQVTRKTSLSGTHVSSSSQKTYVHKFVMSPDGEKEYFNENYSFEITIPKDIIQRATAPPEGAIGDLAKAAQIPSGVNRRIDWYVEAKLDVPKGLDVRKNAD